MWGGLCTLITSTRLLRNPGHPSWRHEHQNHILPPFPSSSRPCRSLGRNRIFGEFIEKASLQARLRVRGHSCWQESAPPRPLPASFSVKMEGGGHTWCKAHTPPPAPLAVLLHQRRRPRPCLGKLWVRSKATPPHSGGPRVPATAFPPGRTHTPGAAPQRPLSRHLEVLAEPTHPPRSSSGLAAPVLAPSL